MSSIPQSTSTDNNLTITKPKILPARNNIELLRQNDSEFTSNEYRERHDSFQSSFLQVRYEEGQSASRELIHGQSTFRGLQQAPMTIIERDVYFPSQTKTKKHNQSDYTKSARKSKNFALNLINVKSMIKIQDSEASLIRNNKPNSFDKTQAFHSILQEPQRPSTMTPHLNSSIKINPYNQIGDQTVIKHKRSQKGIIVGNALPGGYKANDKQNEHKNLTQGLQVMQSTLEERKSTQRETKQAQRKMQPSPDQLLMPSICGGSDGGLELLTQQLSLQKVLTGVNQDSLQLPLAQLQPLHQRSFHKISVEVGSKTNLRDSENVNLNKDLLQFGISQRRQTVNLEHQNFLLVSNNNTLQDTQLEESPGLPINTIKSVREEVSKWTAKNLDRANYSLQQSVDSESQTVLQPMMFDAQSGTLHRQVQLKQDSVGLNIGGTISGQSIVSRAQKVFSVPSGISMEEYGCQKLFEAMKNVQLGDTSEQKSPVSSLNISVEPSKNVPNKNRDSKTFSGHGVSDCLRKPLKVVLHEAPGKMNMCKVDNIRIVTRAMVQNEQRLLSKKRAAINRHKSSKYHSIDDIDPSEAKGATHSRSNSRTKKLGRKQLNASTFSQFTDARQNKSSKERNESIDSGNFEVRLLDSSDLQQASYILSKKYSSLQKSETMKLCPQQSQDSTLLPLPGPDDVHRNLYFDLTHGPATHTGTLQTLNEPTPLNQKKSLEYSQQRIKRDTCSISKTIKEQDHQRGQGIQMIIQANDGDPKTVSGAHALGAEKQRIVSSFYKKAARKNAFIQRYMSQHKKNAQLPQVHSSDIAAAGQNLKLQKRDARISVNQMTNKKRVETVKFIDEVHQLQIYFDQKSESLQQSLSVNFDEIKASEPTDYAHVKAEADENQETQVTQILALVPEPAKKASVPMIPRERLKGMRRRQVITPVERSSNFERKKNSVFKSPNRNTDISHFDFEMIKERNKDLISQFHKSSFPQTSAIPTYILSKQCAQTQVFNPSDNESRENHSSLSGNNGRRLMQRHIGIQLTRSRDVSRKSHNITIDDRKIVVEPRKMTQQISSRHIDAGNAKAQALRDSYVSLYRNSKDNIERFDHLVPEHHNTIQVQSPLVKNRPQTAIVEPKLVVGPRPVIVGVLSNKDFGKSVPETKRKDDTQTEERNSYKLERQQKSSPKDYANATCEERVRESVLGLKDINIFASFCARDRDSEGNIINTISQSAQPEQHSREVRVSYGSSISQIEVNQRDDNLKGMSVLDIVLAQNVLNKAISTATQKIKRSLDRNTAMIMKPGNGHGHHSQPASLPKQRKSQRIKFVETYQTEMFRDSSGLVDRKQMECAQYMDYKNRQIAKLQRKAAKMEQRKQKVRNLNFEKELFEEIKIQNEQKTEDLLQHLLQIPDTTNRHHSLVHFLNNRRKVLTKVSIQPQLEREQLPASLLQLDSNQRNALSAEKVGKSNIKIGVDFESVKSTNSLVPSLDRSKSNRKSTDRIQLEKIDGATSCIASKRSNLEVSERSRAIYQVGKHPRSKTISRHFTKDHLQIVDDAELRLVPIKAESRREQSSEERKRALSRGAEAWNRQYSQNFGNKDITQTLRANETSYTFNIHDEQSNRHEIRIF